MNGGDMAGPAIVDDSATTIDRIRAFIAENKWRYAYTMRWCPHYYVVRNASNEAEFFHFARFIREHGESRRFGKHIRQYFDLDGWTFWSMGPVVDETTTVINRQRTETAARFNKRV